MHVRLAYLWVASGEQHCQDCLLVLQLSDQHDASETQLLPSMLIDKAPPQ
jgi:hypothetical protein